MVYLLVLLLNLTWFESLANNVEDRARLIQLFGRRKPLNTRDRLNTRFSLIGTHLGSKENLVIYSSIASGEECVLRRFDEVTERCEDIERPICGKELVLKRKLVVENCSEQSEYCFTSYRTVHVPVETVVCRSSPQFNCTSNDFLPEKNCYNRSTAFCTKTPQLVTITMKKQPCGDDFKTTNSKMCLTYPDGQWTCQNLTNERCHETNVTKIITNEIATAKDLECSEKVEIECSNSTCPIDGLHQECHQDIVPTKFELKETTCEQCVDGRRKLRPVLEEADICRKSQHTICANVSTPSKWKKWCRPLEIPSHDSDIAVPALKGL